MRDRMGELIVQYEARVDKSGNVEPYKAADGTWEIAGINERYHAAEVAALRRLMAAGDHAGVRRRAASYILKYTELVTGWVTDPGLEFYLRDTYFNRGPDGAARILQMALGGSLEVDGRIGPTTRQELAVRSAPQLLEALRKAREVYENQKYGPRPALRKGLVDRWDKALVEARAFQKGSQVAKGTTAGTVVAGGAAGTAVAKEKGVDISILVALVILSLCAGLIVWKVWPRNERKALQ